MFSKNALPFQRKKKSCAAGIAQAIPFCMDLSSVSGGLSCTKGNKIIPSQNYRTSYNLAFYFLIFFRSSQVSDDLNSYNPWSQEFGEYVIVFQVFDFYVCYRFLVSMSSLSNKYHFFKIPRHFLYCFLLP